MMHLARLGQQDFLDAGERRLAGLHNAVTSGRSVTFVLQNLRGKAEGFESWYEPVRRDLSNDAVCRWFVEIRNRIEKQGSIGTRLMSVNLSMGRDDFRQLQLHAPPGATGVVIGDSLGRSGWTVQLPDGTEHMVYFALPSSMGSIEPSLADAPDGRPLADLLEEWLSKVEAIVDSACARFSN